MNIQQRLFRAVRQTAARVGKYFDEVLPEGFWEKTVSGVAKKEKKGENEMMYKRFRNMEYISAPDLRSLKDRVDSVADEWESTPEDACLKRHCAEPVGAPLFLGHIGFVQALALYYWEDIGEENDVR